AASGSGPVVPLTLLVDPRAPVHAFSGILPMVELSLPPQTVDAALAKMQALFRTGPILATLTSVVSAVGAGDSVAAYAIPQPAEKTGAWSWVERGASGAFTPTQLAPIDATAQFLPEPPTLREGYLALNGGLGSAQETMK
ncbi:MAG TPA: hypothetical protein VI653_27440, partial [Steroidobacteraceae bacterium]